MARWYLRRRGRLYRYGRFRGFRSYTRRYTRPYSRRYVNASSRSSIRAKCVVTGSGTLHSGYASTLGTDVFTILPFSPAAAGNPAPLVASPLFNAYVNLYEEMKLIGMKVQISVTDQIGGSTLPSLQIYTAWDRRHGHGEAAYTPTEIKNSASNNIATALNNNVAKLNRSVYASDLIEKATWMDSTLAGGYVNAWYVASQNPNMFAPAFFMCFGSPSLSAASEVASVHFSVSVTYYVAFRNPRYGGSSSSKDLPSRVVSFPDEDGGDADAVMRDGVPALPPDMPGDFPGDESDEEGDGGAAAPSAEPAGLVRPTGSSLGTSSSVKPTAKTCRTIVVRSKNV